MTFAFGYIYYGFRKIVKRIEASELFANMQWKILPLNSQENQELLTLLPNTDVSVQQKY